MKIAVYNALGEGKGEAELNDAVFGIKVKEVVVHQAYQAARNNARAPLAHTKDRGDVRGGGKKPWKQKGTGRARHGSIRSPIWRGGGITFGPRNDRVYTEKLNKKTNDLALRMCLSERANDGKMIVVEDFGVITKTKDMVARLAKLPGHNYKRLVLLDTEPTAVVRVTRNIPKLALISAVSVNVIDVLSHPYVIVTKKGLEILAKRLA